MYLEQRFRAFQELFRVFAARVDLQQDGNKSPDALDFRALYDSEYTDCVARVSEAADQWQTTLEGWSSEGSQSHRDLGLN